MSISERQWWSSPLHFVLSWLSPKSTISTLKPSDKLVSSLNLPKSPARCVLGLEDTSTKGQLYFVSDSPFSERTIRDLRSVVGAVHPEAIVVESSRGLLQLLDDKLVAADSSQPQIPTKPVDVVRKSLVTRFTLNDYQWVAAKETLHILFGISATSLLEAAEESAKKENAAFFCFEDPTRCLLKEESTDTKSDGQSLAAISLLPATFQVELSGEPSTDQLTSARAPEGSIDTQEALKSPEDSSAEGTEGQGILSANSTPPAFAAQNISPILTSLLRRLGSKTSIEMVENESAAALRILHAVAEGEEVAPGDLRRMQFFRYIIEWRRVSHYRHDLQDLYRKDTSAPLDIVDEEAFSRLSKEEQAGLLTAKALKSLTDEGKKVVVVMDSTSLGGLKRFWSVKVTPALKEQAEGLLMKREAPREDDIGAKDRDAKAGTKGAVVLGVGAAAVAAAAGTGTLKWGSFSSLAQLLGFKAPTTLKVAAAYAKRHAALSSAKAMAPAFNIGGPLHAAGSLGTPVTASAKAAAASKASAGAFATGKGGTASGVTQFVLDVMQRHSVRLMYTAVNNIMRPRNGGTRASRMRPWLLLGATGCTCGTLFAFREEVEVLASIAPDAGQVAKLGRGLQHLEAANNVLAKESFWERFHQYFAEERPFYEFQASMPQR